MPMFSVSLAFFDTQGDYRRDITYYGDSIPDLCAVAESLTPPYEITVYTGEEDDSWIVEQYDEPGDKGNYAGFWHMTSWFTKMDSRTPHQYNNDMCNAINAELDRLGWSSNTAPESNTSLDAFPTETAGIVSIADTQETTCFHSEPLLRVLFDLTTPISYEDLWHAMLPHMAE